MITAGVIGVFLVAYAFIATERIDRVTAALGGVAGVTLLGVVDAQSAFFDMHTGVDWNVVFLLFGMMVVVGVLKQTGLFEFLALLAVRASSGRPARLMVLMILTTATVSALFDNITTVLLIAPVMLSVCRLLGLATTPFLLALVFSSNIGGAATLIGDPPNIIIASRAGLTFNDFLVHMLPGVLAIMVVLVVLCLTLFRRDLRVPPPDPRTLQTIEPRSAIREPAKLARCGVVLVGLMAAFALHSALHLDPSIVAMMGAGAMVLVTRSTPEQFLEEVEWNTLVFFMALFVLVGSLVQVGVIGDLGAWASEHLGDHPFLAATVLLFGSAVLGAFVDNIPYTTATVPIVADLVAASGDTGASNPLWWSFAFGADLGGNTTAVAAGANVVVLGIAHKEGAAISFWQFTRYGIVVTLASLLVAWGYVWLRYF